jgi:tRNA(Ile)-lysidine synthase
VEHYVRRHRLSYVDDDSNCDARFARNRLRLQVWPGLLQAFPDAAHVLADAAAHAADAAACLAQLAELDRAAASTGAGGLRVPALLALGPARGRNLLRAWLHERLGQPAPAALVDRLCNELNVAGPARWDCGNGELRLYRGELHWVAKTAEPQPAVRGGAVLDWPLPGPGEFALPAPWGGLLLVRQVARNGVPASVLMELRLQSRCGGEQFQGKPGAVARALKKQYQAAGVPSWARSGPLLFAGDRLVFVPGLGLDARALAQAGEAQVAFEWNAGGSQIHQG